MQTTQANKSGNLWQPKIFTLSFQKNIDELPQWVIQITIFANSSLERQIPQRGDMVLMGLSN